MNKFTKHLFDERLKPSKDSIELQKKLQTALNPLFDEYTKLGYSPREICYLVCSMATALSSDKVIGSMASFYSKVNK